TRPLDAVSPRTTTAADGHDPRSGKQTIVQTSLLEPRTYRSKRSPGRGSEERSAKTAMAACACAPCIWKPSTELHRTQASGAHRGFEEHPITGFPGSSAGSDHTDHNRCSVALPSSETSSARKP